MKKETWIKVGHYNEIEKRGARVIWLGQYNLAVFKVFSGEIFAIRDECPHRQGPLSEGLLQGYSVACPLHDWSIDLRNGKVDDPDVGCVESFPVKVEGEEIFVQIALDCNSTISESLPLENFSSVQPTREIHVGD